MTQGTRPDGQIFASDAADGELEDFPAETRGWGVTLDGKDADGNTVVDATSGIPPMEWMNGILNKLSAQIFWNMQHAIPAWTAGTWDAAAFVTYSGFVYYNNSGQATSTTPGSDSTWVQLFSITGLDGRYLQTKNNLSEIANAGADAQSSSRQNLGLGSAATHNEGDFLSSSGGTLTGDSGVLTLKSKTQDAPLFIKGLNSDNAERFYIGNPDNDADFIIKNYSTGNSINLNSDGGVVIYPSKGAIRLAAASDNYNVIVGNKPKKANGLLQPVVEGDYGIAIYAVNDAVTTTGYTTSAQIIAANSNKGWEMCLYCTGDATQQTVFSGKINISNTVTGVSYGFNFQSDGTFVPASYANFDSRYQRKNSASLTVNGWFKDASTGYIRQWGLSTGIAYGNTINYPIAFPTAAQSVIAIDGGVPDNNNPLNLGTRLLDATKFEVYTSMGTATTNWGADGYGTPVSDIKLLRGVLFEPEFESAYLYSATNNAFYPAELYFDYVHAGTWPDDVVAVDDSVYIEFAASAAPDGKVRVAGSDGMPTWGDIPAPMPEVLMARNAGTRQKYLTTALAAIGVLQCSAAVGKAHDGDADKLLELQRYVDELRYANLASAPIVPPQLAGLVVGLS